MLRNCFAFLLLTAFSAAGVAQTGKTQTGDRPVTGKVAYTAPDTTKAIAFYNEVTLPRGAGKNDGQYISAGFSRGSIRLFKKGMERGWQLHLRDTAGKPEILAKGNDVTENPEATICTWKYNWQTATAYKTLVTALPDSASCTTIYAAYLFLPEKQQWKMLATVRASSDGDYLRGLYAGKENSGSPANKADTLRIANAWLQRSNNTWYEFTSQRPLIDLAKNTDSLSQAGKDRAAIVSAVRNGKLDTTGSREGVYYHILKEGTGETVSVTDTVTVFYKGFLLSNGSVFDQTKDKPATFPLKRLIRGWQIAIPMSRVGGTVRVIIPSGLAYGIRARSKDIPPNSVLVFDVEVVKTKKAV
ncbi:FKBP-type peptidyl-prolyl cis-trans isomerase [Sediminibacterium soli]|uniref:FKBP-type peptidyl-prolyl cis-trans isomerase n=1 Tax=Sediminibacterium soli TaxID=2698829 RepID=UPI00137AD1C4|nr:FKBP-type peptidyl-prolyl cis-trans isomerase [Sediminibacterium soli]NCI46980.1 DUF3472 domain-containing protein [Sediminibacterium soli]